MTTNGNSKPATRENLKAATANYRAAASHKSIVDQFISESIHGSADSAIGVMARELTDLVAELEYIDALEFLARVGMVAVEEGM